MTHKLSGGVISDILDGKNPSKPRVQVLKNYNSLDRYYAALIAIQLNPMISSGELDNYTIIQINEYNINDLPNGKKVLIIIEVDVVTPGEKVGDRIGTPVAYKAGDKRPVEAALPVKKEMAFYGQNNKENKFTVKTKHSAGGHGDSAPTKIYPIMSLTPYQNKWTIRARITNKSEIRTWNNSKGSGKLFSVTLMDESGQIKATLFKNEVDKFYDVMENDRVYYISRAQLKTANKQFNHLKNEYELTFSGDTTVELCEEEVDIPDLEYDFCKIQDIQEKAPNTVVDVIAVMKSVGNLSSITTKATQRQLSKLEVTLVDEGLLQINLTLWGQQAEKFSESGNPIIAVRDAKVSDWNGRSLSVSGSSEMTINPKLDAAKTLKTWFETEGQTATMSEYARDGGDKYLTMAQVDKITSELTGDKAEYFLNDGIVIFVKKDNCLYKACPGASCNKKLIELGNDLYRCEKCSQEVDTYEWRMLLQAHFSDCTGDLWGTCFQESSESILGMPIKEVAELREQDDEAYNKVFENALFKPFSFKFRSKMENYNDEARIKSVCLSANQVNYAEKNINILNSINKLMEV